MNRVVLVAISVLSLACTALARPIVWEFPLEATCHEGLAFADGQTGVLVWGGGETIRLTIGRADLWDHRGGYPWTAEQSYTNIVSLWRAGEKDRLVGLFKHEPPPNWGSRYNPYMLPLGRVVITVPGETLVRGELDPQTGLGRLMTLSGREIKLAMSKASRTFVAKAPANLAIDVKSIPATDFSVWEILKNRQFEKAVKLDASDGATGGFNWNLPADQPVWLTWRKSGAEVALRTGRGTRLTDCTISYEQVAGESVAQWQAFWKESARISVPDAVVQDIFDYGMYRFGAMTDPDGFPAGLQGPWLEDDRLVPWCGDYHFNINVQECYSPAFRGGHFRNLMPLFSMVRRWWPRLRENARMFCGIADGFVLPHSVDDRGVCIGGFWTGTIDHASTAWIASLMFRYVRYSGDTAFLKTDAYPFMKGAMNVYLAMVEEVNGSLSISLGPSPEWGGSDFKKAVGRNPSFQLAAAHRLARDLIAASELLGEAADPRWLDLEKRLPPYRADATGFLLFDGQRFNASHRHHSHMAGLYPFNTIDMSDKQQAGDAFTTYRNWVLMGNGEWSGWCVPWAAILHTHFGSADAAVHALRSWKEFYTNRGHGSLHDAIKPGFTIFTGRPHIMQMDGQCAAVTAAMELMVHECGARTEYFRGCPATWKNVSFENMRLSDGRCISGRRVDGVVTIEREN